MLHRYRGHAICQAAGQEQQRFRECRPNFEHTRWRWSSRRGRQHDAIGSEQQSEDHSVAHQEDPETEYGMFGFRMGFGVRSAKVQAGMFGFACAHDRTRAKP